ncbi:MAG: hypothetical protein WDN69_16605 [Aliidongia sp.]
MGILSRSELTALVEKAIAGNLDLKVALARLQEAETQRPSWSAPPCPRSVSAARPGPAMAPI